MGESDEKGGSLDALLGEIARAPDVTPASDLLGKTLGRYRVDALLGRGGMGLVYRVHDTKLARDVALKVLPPDLLTDPERRARFLKEARVAASITHPCTAAVYDVGEEGEVVYVAMELVKGKTLRALIGEKPDGLDDAEVARIGAEIARGLTKAHEAGIVHRDLKPETVMLDEDGQVKILDPGLAKLRETVSEGSKVGGASTELGRVMGTPSYMSPEQAKGKTVDARSDLFSLGIVLYEMLSGKQPFKGETTVEVLIAIDRDDPPALAPTSKLAKIVERCLEKKPDDRWPNTRALATALREVVTVPSVRAPTPRRRSSALYLVGAAFAAVAVLGVVASRRTPATTAASGAPANAAVLAKEDLVIACPPLEASGVAAPTGWLGAVAANIACRRTTVILGGRTSRTLVPAELLDLPRGPSDDLSRDVYGDPTARARAMDAARKRASAYFDGTVERKRDGFFVHLELHARDGGSIAAGDGEGRVILAAVAGAMSKLPLAERTRDPELVEWTGLRSTALALLVEDYLIGEPMGATTGTYEVLSLRKDDLGALWPQFSFREARAKASIELRVDPPAIDRTSPAMLARSAGVRALVTNDVSASVADELHSLGARHPPESIARRELTLAEAAIRYSSGDAERPSDITLPLLASHSRSSALWDLHGANSYGRPGNHALAKASAAWVPEQPDTWNQISFSMEQADPAPPLAFQRRSFEIGGDLPLFAATYAVRLLFQAKRADARSVAGHLLGGEAGQQRAGEAILAMVEASEGRFGAALARGQTLASSLPNIGAIESGTVAFIGLLIDASELSGRGTSVADLLAERFVLSEPPRIFPGHFAAIEVAALCARTRPEIAGRCIERVMKLVADGYFREGLAAGTKPFVEGSARWIRGDVRGAVEAWRPILAARVAGMARQPFLITALDRSGDLAAAEEIDAFLMNRALYNGASPAHVRAAKRAVKRGDVARARKLARAVIEAWSTADVPVDAVREMRELLAKLPAE